MKEIRRLRALVLALATALTVAVSAPVANANTGDVLRDLGNQAGTGVAFDGSDLYYIDTAGLTLNRVSTTGTTLSATPVAGAAGLQALTYDATRNVFWGVDSTGLTVYTLDKSGLALLQFAIDPTTDLPGLCGSLTGCSPTIDGLAYDATDDSLWLLPHGSTRIYHVDTAGNALGYVDVSSLGCSTATGVAAGADSLFVTACGHLLRAAKTDTGASAVASSFVAPGGDVECDDVTFGNADVAWVRDPVTRDLVALQLPNGACVHGGGVFIDPTKAWMTGGGSTEAQATNANISEAHFGFMIHCTSVDGSSVSGKTTPNTLNITWDTGSGFHLNSVTSTQTCTPPPASSPTAAFDELDGSGSGRLRLEGKTQAGTATWRFVDNGDPGTLDEVVISVFDAGGNLVLATTDACNCLKGNLQAHQQS